ncbi:hypothetical protein HY11_00105 [Hyphomonas pacifica]|nr:hypothetical protein HY11_00105 [Hyphomonas pacifica]
MDEAAAGRHPLDTAFADDAFMARAVTVGEFAFQNEGDRLKAAMRVRAEGQAAIVRRIDLRPVMVQEEERADVANPAPRDRAAGDEIANIVPHGGVDGDDGFELWHAALLMICSILM